jgi:hypothetical protein
LAACPARALLAAPAGCRRVGEAAGKAVKSVEKSAEDFQEGFRKGKDGQ